LAENCSRVTYRATSSFTVPQVSLRFKIDPCPHY